MTNRGEKTVDVADIVEGATVARHPYPPKTASKGFVSLLDVPKPERPFHIIYHTEWNRAIHPGATADYAVIFSPTAEGHEQSSFGFFDFERRYLGGVDVSGNGKQPEKEPDENVKKKSGDDYVVPKSGSDDVKLKRHEAKDALNTLNNTVKDSLNEYHKGLLEEWIDYYAHTGMNPTISPESLPGGPSMLAHLLEHTIAGGVAKAEEIVIEHTFKHLFEDAEHTAAHAVAKVGTVAVGSEVGSLAGFVGAVIGFVVGVLIETAAGEIYESVIRKKEEAEQQKMLEEEYLEGQKSGFEEMGKLILKKISEEEEDKAKALSDLDKIGKQYWTLVLGTTSVKRIDRLKAEIEAQTDLAGVAKPTKGFSRALREIWARDHAGTGTKEVPGKQLAEVSEEVHYALEQPDLFVTQCLHEWGKRGLAVTPQLEATIRAELSQFGVHEISTSGGESSKNKGHAMALGAQKRFNDREFVWKDVSHLQGFDSYIAMSRLLPDDFRHGVRAEGGDVYCAPSLVVNGSTCSVSRFHYRVKTHGLTFGAFSSPGDSSFEAYGDDRSTGEDAGIAVYDLMRELRGYGVTIAQKPDALHNPWLQQTFGADTAVPKLQQTDGQQSGPVAVFEGAELLVPQNDLYFSRDTLEEEGEPLLSTRGGVGGAVPNSLFLELKSRGAPGPGNNLMIRGGDTILVLHGKWRNPINLWSP
jgi:hypothetical protein